MRVLFAVYLIVQGLLAFGWWLLMLLRPESIDYLLIAPEQREQLLVFLIGDLLIFADGSILAGALLLSRQRGAIHVLFVTVGGIAYAGLTALSDSLFNGSSWLATSLILSAAILTVIIALEAVRLFSSRSRTDSTDYLGTA